MRRLPPLRPRGLIVLALLLAGCGSAPTSPTPPPPVPASIHVIGTLTDTVSGAPLGSVTQTVTSLPTLIPVSVVGYLTRQARISSASPTIDLIPEAAPFDLGFYRQLVRNGYEAPGTLEPLRRLTQAPSIYLQTAGLTAANVAALETAARVAVFEFSGHTMGVVAFESGPEARAAQTGWITVNLVSASEPCGRALIGAVVGQAWMNTASRCAFGGYAVYPSSFAHEIGHAMGFWHVSAGLMKSDGPYSVSEPTAVERYHAGIAYHRQAGNRDVDSDSLNSPLSVARVVVD